MKNTKTHLQLDALTLCFTFTDPVINSLLVRLSEGQHLDFKEFLITRIKQGHWDYIFQIGYLNEHGEFKQFGTLYFSNATAKSYVWLKLSNETLYNGDWLFFDYIADKLGLEFNHITNLDIAIDTQKNIYKAIRHLQRDKAVTEIVKGKRVSMEDNEGIIYCQSGTRRCNYLHKSLYIKQYDNGATLKIYDKRGELQAEGDKPYILDLYGNPRSLWRCEIHLKRKQIYDWLATNDKTLSPYNLREETLIEMYCHYLERLLRFAKNRKPISWASILF